MIISIQNPTASYTDTVSTASTDSSSSLNLNLHWEPETYTEEAAALCAAKSERIAARNQTNFEATDAAIRAAFSGGTAVELQIGGTTTSVSESDATAGASSSSASTKSKTYDIEYWEVEKFLSDTTINDGDTVMVDGVSFTGTQIKSFQDFYVKLKSFLPSTYTAGMDYRDYAKLGVGMSLASAFSAGMTQEQQDEINKIVQYYEDEVLDTHSRRISLYDPITASDGQYYNTYYSIEKCEEVDHVDLEKYGVEYALAVNEASDTSLADTIRTLFMDADVTNSDSMKNLWDQYVNVIEDAYKEKCGDYWKDWCINDDEFYFATMISDAQSLLNSLGTRSVDTVV